MTIKCKRVYTSILIVFLFICIPVLISGTIHNATNTVFVNQAITPPKVQDKVSFANESILLNRIDLRERMDRELMSFSYMHSSSILMIKRANRYFPMIEKILKENSVPDDFKYLMVIESSMNPKARSGAGAAGFWQFMVGTAKDYNLEVNKQVDERYNIEKATIAACSYLKDAYKKYGSWITAAASYNAGQRRISNELAKQDVENAVDLWLVEETSRYIFRLAAAKQLFEDPKQFGFYLTADQLYPAITFKKVKVTKSIPDLVEFAKEHNSTYALLKEYNPWLISTKLDNQANQTYYIDIPTEKSMYLNPKDIKPYNPNWVVKSH